MGDVAGSEVEEPHIDAVFEMPQYEFFMLSDEDKWIHLHVALTEARAARDDVVQLRTYISPPKPARAEQARPRAKMARVHCLSMDDGIAVLKEELPTPRMQQL